MHFDLLITQCMALNTIFLHTQYWVFCYYNNLGITFDSYIVHNTNNKVNVYPCALLSTHMEAPEISASMNKSIRRVCIASNIH